MPIYTLQLAGFILICIVVANFFAPKKMRWIENLKNVELLFKQVFIVHAVFLVACIFGMAFVCLFFPRLLITETIGGLLLGFMACFWIARVFVQFLYYEPNIKKEYPVFTLIFNAAFIYLAVIFTAFTIQTLK